MIVSWWTGVGLVALWALSLIPVLLAGWMAGAKYSQDHTKKIVDTVLETVHQQIKLAELQRERL